MSVRQEISWLRLAAESAAVVASILLAFAIDAWWQDRNELATEQRILNALLAEFEENGELLRLATEDYERGYSDAIRMLTYLDDGTDDIDPSEFDQLIRGLLFSRSTHLETGAHDALIASGELSLIRDESLRNRLAAWPSYLNEWSEEEEAVFAFGDEYLVPYLSDSVRLRNISNPFLAFPDGQSPPPVPVGLNEAVSVRPFFTSVEFDNLVYVRAQGAWYAMRDGETLRAQLTMILNLIRENLNE